MKKIAMSKVKKLLKPIPKKIIGFYMVWVWFHIQQFVTGSGFSYNSYFYPMYYKDSIDAFGKPIKIEGAYFNSYAYDYTELLIYLLIPIAIYLISVFVDKSELKERWWFK